MNFTRSFCNCAIIIILVLFHFCHSTEVTLYTHHQYKGHKQIYRLGGTCTDLTAISDQVSSVRVHSGCVRLCSRRHCRQCQEVNEDIPNLATIEINDAVKAIEPCSTTNFFSFRERTGLNKMQQQDSLENFILLPDKGYRYYPSKYSPLYPKLLHNDYVTY